MITDKGIQIISKYLVEQATSYAGYIAVGCGLNPTSTIVLEDFSNSEALEFEMFRVPIVSRSHSSINGVSKLTFSAELPSQEIYYITEAGIFSSGSNPVATLSDSKTLYSFSSEENWEYHTSTTTSAVTSSNVPEISSGDTGIIDSANLTSPFYIDTTDPIFTNSARYPGDNYIEQPRFLNNSVMIPGGMSTIANTTGTDTTGIWTATGQSHIHLTNQVLPFDVNSSVDQLKLAFSILKTDPDASNAAVQILVEFSSSETEEDAGEYARMKINVSTTDYTSNDGYYYFVKSQPFSSLLTSPSFSWDAVRVVKVFVQASNDNGTYVVIDGLRFENIFDMTANPNYGLTAMSPFYTISGLDYKPKLKDENTSNIIEIEVEFEHHNPEVVS